MALSIAALIVLTGRLRIHAFLAPISASIMMGFAIGIAPSDLVKCIVEDFGATVGYVGLMVFAATIVGELLAKTGAAVVISESILKSLGKQDYQPPSAPRDISLPLLLRAMIQPFSSSHQLQELLKLKKKYERELADGKNHLRQGYFDLIP